MARGSVAPSRPGGIARCKKNVWVRFKCYDKNAEGIEYLVEKSVLQRVYTGPYEAVINARCMADKYGEQRKYTFEQGSTCQVFNDTSNDKV